MSSSALRQQWASLRQQHRTALIPYLTAGHPTPAASLAALRMVAEAGADLVEVGIPFSDPLADGPVIQQASQTALSAGMTVAGTLGLIREASLPIPVIVFGYLNPILAYGLDRFLCDASDAGVAGLLVTDLPAGEDPAIEHAVRTSGLALVPLVAITTDEARLPRMLGGADGFVYLISRLGVTGAHTTLDAMIEHAIAKIHRATSLPVAVGFGIATPDQAATIARHADGVVVGSALIRRLGDGVDAGRELMNELRSALDREAGTRG